MIKYGANPLQTTKDGKNALHLYALSIVENDDNIQEMIDFLVSLGLSLNSCDNDKNTPLHHVMSLEVEEYQYFVTEENINAQNKDGVTPLMICTRTKAYESIEYFVSTFGPDVNVSDFNGDNALTSICYEETTPLILRLFLNNGLDPNLTDSDGITPLHLAMMYAITRHDDNTRLVRRLLLRGAIPKKDKEGKTPFDYFKEQGPSYNRFILSLTNTWTIQTSNGSEKIRDRYAFIEGFCKAAKHVKATEVKITAIPWNVTITPDEVYINDVYGNPCFTKSGKVDIYYKSLCGFKYCLELLGYSKQQIEIQVSKYH